MKGEVALSERSLGSEVDGTLASAMLFTLPSELHQDGGVGRGQCSKLKANNGSLRALFELLGEMGLKSALQDGPLICDLGQVTSPFSFLLKCE